MESSPGPAPPMSLATAALAGTGYVFLVFAAFYHLVPFIWTEALGVTAGLTSEVLRLAVMGIVLGVGAFMAPRVLPQRDHLRGGITLALLYVLFGLFVVYVICYLIDGLFHFFTARGWLSQTFYDNRWTAGLVIAGAVSFGYGRALWRRLKAPTFEKNAAAIEEQGWLNFGTYKPGQGRMIRRFTLLAAMALVAGG
ncbi:MAG TPA: hypothetical protein PKC45_11245, partial [Gemmatales bacterium]|nr:hypothetical protein [Gemmatales bacterium]